jgi:hypothetical protein
MREFVTKTFYAFFVFAVKFNGEFCENKKVFWGDVLPSRGRFILCLYP